MEFFHGVVALVAGIVLILTGLVAWLYVQQSRMSQAINALAIAITAPPPSFFQNIPEPEVSHEAEFSEMQPQQHEEEHGEDVAAPHDDRVSVHEEEEDEDIGMIGEDMTALPGKTANQLRDMLTAKGIPFSKSDKKSTLISLIQAAS